MAYILIVDRLPNIRKCIQNFFMKRVLPEGEYEILHTYSAKEATKLIQTKKPALIVIGDLMIDEHPLVFLVSVYNNAPDAKYIVCATDEEFNRAAMASGTHAVFTVSRLLSPSQNTQYLDGIVKTFKTLL